MIRTFCDRDGSLITGAGFTMNWFDGSNMVSSVLCQTCQSDLVKWFAVGNRTPGPMQVQASDLPSASVAEASANA